MVTILLKERLKYRNLLFILGFIILLHLSGKLILADEFSLSVLTYYELENRYFYVIVKYLLPFIIFLYIFVFTIDLNEDYSVLILIRNPNKYSHIKAISLFIFGISIVYWGVYFLLFTFLTGTSLDLIGKEMLRSAIITCQISSFYFCLTRLMKSSQIAGLLACLILVVLSFQSQILVDILTLSPLAIVIVIMNLVTIMIYIRKIGVIYL